MTNEITTKRRALVSAASQAIEASAMTLAQHGVDKDVFAGVVREAVLANPDVLKADTQSFARAIAKCCRDNIIPDGDYGALVVFKGEVRVVPMAQGILRMAREMLGAEIRSGVVYKGDDVRVVEGVGVEPTIEITTTGTDPFERRKGTDVIGAWCWIKLPEERHPRITLFSSDDILRARQASHAQRGAHQIWPDRMAEKSCIKSAIWRLRYLASAKTRGQHLFSVLKEDTDDDLQGVIDAEFEDVQEQQPVSRPVQTETTAEDPPKRRRGRPKGSKNRPKEETQPQPQPQPQPAPQADPEPPQDLWEDDDGDAAGFIPGMTGDTEL